MKRSVVLFSGGLLLMPIQAPPLQDHLQPILPTKPTVADKPDRGLEGLGYACGHPFKGQDYARIKGVGNLPKDIVTGGWTCSHGCGIPVPCAYVIRYTDPEKEIVSDYEYIYRPKSN